MIDINFKYVLIAFLILVISSCAIVLLTINSNDESSSIKLITSVTEDSSTSDSTETSQTRNKDSSGTRETQKTTGARRTIRKTTTAGSNKTTTTTTQVKFPLDINKTTKDELMEIDGVGEVTASRILSYRKKLGYYSNLLQLKEVDGIGDATYKKLRKYLYVSKDKFKEMTESKGTSKNEAAAKTTKSKTIKYKTAKTTKTTQATTEKEMKIVNINTANKEELMESLIIDEEEATEIIGLREKVGGKYINKLQLLLAATITESEYNRIKDYITI